MQLRLNGLAFEEGRRTEEEEQKQHELLQDTRSREEMEASQQGEVHSFH